MENISEAGPSGYKPRRNNNSASIPLQNLTPPGSPQEYDEIEELLGGGDDTDVPEKDCLTQHELISLCMAVDNMNRHGMQPVSLTHVLEPLMQIPEDDAGDEPETMGWGSVPAAPRPHASELPFSLYPSVIPTEWIPGDETASGMLRAIDDNNIPQLLRYLDQGADPNSTYPLTPVESQALCTLRWSDELGTYQQTPTWEGPQAHWTLLQWASAWCRAEAAAALLARGARAADARDGRTALDVAGAALAHRRRAPSAQDFLRTVRELVEAGARCEGAAGALGALHAAARLGCARGAALLLAAGADGGARDYSGFSALHIAVGKKDLDVFVLLLHHGLGVHDAAKLCERANMEDLSGATPLQLAAAGQWPAGVSRLLAAGAAVDRRAAVPRPRRVLGYSHELDYTPLHIAVKTGNMEIFNMIFEVAKRERCIDCRSADGETPLTVAIEQGRLEIVKILVRNGASLTNIKSDGSNALHIAAGCYHENKEVLPYLLGLKKTELLNELNKNKDAPVHVATKTRVGMEPLITLCYHGADLRLKDGRDGSTPLHIAASLNLADLVGPILFEEPDAIDDLDNKSRTPLQVAGMTPSKEFMLELLKHGPKLIPSKVDSEVPSVIKLIDANIPNPGLFFTELFDGCAKQESRTGFLSHSIVDYSVLTSTDDQLAVVEELIEHGQEKILIHPVIETLLHLKWRTLLPVFWFIIIINALFVAAVNLFAGTVFYYRDIQKNATEYLSGAACPTRGYCAFVVIFTVLIYLSLGVLVALEYVYVRAQGRAHWRRLESWVRVAALTLGALLPAAALAAPNTDPPRWLAALALLAAWLALIYLFSRFPNWGYYFLMIAKVAANLMKVLLTCVFLIVAFAHCFMILYKAESPFDGPLVAFTKTLVMMTGEYEYENLFGDSHKALDSYREWVRLLFIAFVLFVTLVLMNVMLGVAVTDINDLTVTGNIRRLIKQTEVLTTLEDLLYENETLSSLLKKRNINKKCFKQVKIAPATEKAWTVVYSAKKNNPVDAVEQPGKKEEKKDKEDEYQTKLPSHLHANLIAKSKKEVENMTSLGNIANHISELRKFKSLHKHMDDCNCKKSEGLTLDDRINEMASEIGTIKNYLTKIMHKLDKA